MKILLEKGDSEKKVKMAEALLANGLVCAIERVAYRTAVYRVLVDFCGWEKDITKFTLRMNTLLKDVHLKHPCTYQAIQKPLSSNSILRKNYEEWQVYDASRNNRVFPRQMFIAEKLLKLLSINA